MAVVLAEACAQPEYEVLYKAAFVACGGLTPVTRQCPCPWSPSHLHEQLELWRKHEEELPQWAFLQWREPQREVCRGIRRFIPLPQRVIAELQACRQYVAAQVAEAAAKEAARQQAKVVRKAASKAKCAARRVELDAWATERWAAVDLESAPSESGSGAAVAITAQSGAIREAQSEVQSVEVGVEVGLAGAEAPAEVGQVGGGGASARRGGHGG
jgi:hypothetical protein